MSVIGVGIISAITRRTFESTRLMFEQTHFTVIEIDLPTVTGTCTIGGADGFGTPLSCDQVSDSITTYKFTQEDAPLLPESGILRLVKSISETPTKLNSGRGLSSRGTGSIKLFDITGKDPNPWAAGVTDAVKNQGGYLAKLAVRNELTNKPLRIKNYRVNPDGGIDLEFGAQTRHYIIDAMTPSKNGEWNIKFKDELSSVNIDETVWPLPLEGYLVNDITDAQTTFNVDPNVTYLVDDTIRVGDELMKITAVDSIGTGTANITVLNRSNAIAYTNVLSVTQKEDHSLGDEIFVCEVSDNERIDDLLERILLDIGIDPARIPKADWVAEIDLWHPTTFINTIWIESEDTFQVLEKILTYFMIDMWFDPVSRLIKISSISVWQESVTSLIEGDQIDFESLNKNKEEALRSTRALVFYDKRNLTNDDDITSYRKGSLFARTDLEIEDLFGKAKTKKFEPSNLIVKESADILVNRWVNRYSNPHSFTWTTQERKLTFATGDVVDIKDLTTVNFAGLPEANTRAQITSIRPNYTEFGRSYNVSALSYEPNFVSGTEIVITGSRTDINLYTQFAGAPSLPVELTFIFDATLVGGASISLPAIRAGAFPAGSKLILILINGADLQAAGGLGGSGESFDYDFEDNDWIRYGVTTGGAGGVVYDAEGVPTDIYFSGTTPSAKYPTADGFIRAPSGGDGGYESDTVNPTSALAGLGGNGGDGRNGGAGGAGGKVRRGPTTNEGSTGLTGSPSGALSGWGNVGNNNDSTGGLPGKGIIDSGATVTLFGEDAARYINGGGDHP
jgi:hypothetical protein